ncbi:14779_t:CDS:2, partial [Acaulospora colombiana]
SSGESNPTSFQVPSPQMVTSEQVRQAAAEIGAITSLMWVDPEDGDKKGPSNEQGNDPALDEFTKRVFRTLATVAYWHVLQKKKDVRNPASGKKRYDNAFTSINDYVVYYTRKFILGPSFSSGRFSYPQKMHRTD